MDLRELALDTLAYPPVEGIDAARTRAAQIVATLSTIEKYTLLRGVPGAYIGYVPSAGSLPAIALNDGPAGASWMNGVTAFPAPIALAATWHRDLVRRWATAMGAEERAKGVAVQLGPMLNLTRTPQGGRNFEGFGEDPYLTAELAIEAVNGIQANKVVATAKHFVGNEQESNRLTGNSLIDERTLHEVYYLPFEASISAGVGAVMCSYNQVNGAYGCENPVTLGDLKSGLGFSGWVMSDWGATHSGKPAANAGLDMEMPSAAYFSDGALGTVPATRLDDMATRVLTSLVRVGVIDDPPQGDPTVVVTSPEHTAVALEAATESITLLKNSGPALPLDASIRSIAVIGTAGDALPYSTGQGSAHVEPPYVTSPFQAISARAPEGTVVTYQLGDDAPSSLARAVDAAASAEVAIVVIAIDSTEGADRGSLALDPIQDQLIREVAAVNSRTIVVLDTPGAVLLPWFDAISALVVAWYPGQENGNAIASVLFGDTNPSGKLPVTFPVSASALPAPDSAATVAYSEGLAVGYRRLDQLAIIPQFEFGFGLSYTSFEYDQLELQTGAAPGSLDVSFDLTNTGSLAGAEVAQLYLTFPTAAGEPPRLLRGFERLSLDPHETRRVHIELPPRAFSCWNPTTHARYAPSGVYGIAVGSSSRNLPLQATFELLGVGKAP